LHHAVSTGAHAAFAEEVLAATAGKGVSVVLDLVGAAYLSENLRALGLRGRMVHVGTLSGASGSIDLGLVMRKRLTLFGTVLRTRPLEERVALTRRFGDELLAAFASGRIAPIVDRVLPAAEVHEAHELLASGSIFGKLVLRF
jgi:NADPH:quinone reductase-like Zn-dependent oxidoreductase